MSNFIQEVLGLLNRNQKKITLDKNKDWFEFGKLYQTGTLNTGTSYSPKMDPFVIKWGDLVCQATEDLTRTLPGQGNLGFVPVYTDPSGPCNADTLKNSIITQNALNDTINIAGNLVVSGTVKLDGTIQDDAPNKVLVIDGNNIVRWRAASTIGGGGGVTSIIAGTNITISPTGGTGAVTINASSAAPKVFAALISQETTSPPTMITVYDSYAGAVTWTWYYIAPGVYNLTASLPIFVESRVVYYIIPDATNFPGTTRKPYVAAIRRFSDTELIINSWDYAPYAYGDGLFEKATLKIEFYN